MPAEKLSTPPSEYGHRLVPTLIDEYARTDPDYVFAMIPKTDDFADGLQKITISAFARAVNEIASRIDSGFGKSTNFDTIAYIGPSQSLPRQFFAPPELTRCSGSQILCHCHRCFQSRL